MANGNQTPDLETPFPTGGFLGGDQQNQTSTPQPASAPQAPPAAPAQGALGGLDAVLGAGLAGQAMPAGQMVQQRHGGLLTGLAGVLLDGLASGMAPNAAMASQLPMIRQQQAMQQQQMQMQQQKMQEEMRLQPVRDKLLLMQAHMQMVQLSHAMREMTTQSQLGLSDFTKGYINDAIKGNRAEEVTVGSMADVNKYLQDHVHDPDGMQLFPQAKKTDADGNVTEAAVVKIDPKAQAPAVHREWTHHDPVANKDYQIKVDMPAGDQDAQLAAITHDVGAQYAEIAAQSKPESPTQGLMQAINRAQQAGKSGQAVFDDPNVKTAIQAIQATQKPGSGFESEAYGQYVQGEQAKGRQPLSMVEFQRQLWPQTQIALGGLAVKQAAEERQEAGAQYQATDPTGRPVAGSMAELQAAGIPKSKITKQTAVQQQQTDAARDMISPDGLFAIARRQMMDLDAKGKLGPIASRWNNFWARKGLDGDQQAFRNTLDLLGSRLMAAHLQRTNVSALEHFGKMIPENSTPTAFKKELNEEYKYVVGQSKTLGGPAAQ